jgi:hypothetical protein
MTKSCYTQVGSDLTHKYLNRLEYLPGNKHFSLFDLFISSKEKKFYDIEIWAQYHEAFLSIILSIIFVHNFCP